MAVIWYLIIASGLLTVILRYMFIQSYRYNTRNVWVNMTAAAERRKARCGSQCRVQCSDALT